MLFFRLVMYTQARRIGFAITTRVSAIPVNMFLMQLTHLLLRAGIATLGKVISELIRKSEYISSYIA